MLGFTEVRKDVNVGEVIGKTVGKRTVGNPLSTKTSGKEHAEVGVNSVPRGVYRFDSHEEADEWMTKMLARPRKS